MNKPYCAPHNAPHLINRDPRIVGKYPPPRMANLSTYKSLKSNFISYLGESAAKDIVPQGFLLPHNKDDVGLKAVASDSKATLFDSKVLLFDSQADPFNLKSMDFNSKSMDYDSKSMDFNLKSMDFDLKSKPFIFRNKHTILPCEAQSLQEGIPIKYKGARSG
jgi:hypothetical protein